MLAITALGVTAAGASAGTLSASGSTVTFKAKAGESNRVTITQTGNSVEVRDAAVIPPRAPAARACRCTATSPA